MPAAKFCAHLCNKQILDQVSGLQAQNSTSIPSAERCSALAICGNCAGLGKLSGWSIRKTGMSGMRQENSNQVEFKISTAQVTAHWQLDTIGSTPEAPACCKWSVNQMPPRLAFSPDRADYVLWSCPIKDSKAAHSTSTSAVGSWCLLTFLLSHFLPF